MNKQTVITALTSVVAIASLAAYTSESRRADEQLHQ